MTNTDSKIEERMPVWKPLSELFLDTELQTEDYDRIAAVLATSPYSEDKIEEILRFEVSPVCHWNMLSPAGEWAGFDDAWLRKKITPRLDKRPLFRRRVFSLVREPWGRIKKKVADLRAKWEKSPTRLLQ